MVFKRSVFAGAFAALMFLAVSMAGASTAEYSTMTPQAGGEITIAGQINPGDDVVVVVSSEKLFKGSDSPGSQEKEKLEKKFGETAIPPIFYILTNTKKSCLSIKCIKEF